MERQMVTEAVQECRQGRGMSWVEVGCLHEKLLDHSRLLAVLTVGHVRCPLGPWE